MKVINHQKQPVVTQRFNNTTAGIQALHKWLKVQGVCFNEHSLLVIENTGIYHRFIWRFCSDYNLPLHIGNAAHIKWSFGIARGKNDRIDSIRLCQYALKHADELKAAPVLNPVFNKLKDLMTARTKLLTQMNAIKTWLKELKLASDREAQKLIEKTHKAALEGLKRSIILLQAAIKQTIEADSCIKVNYDLLLTVPGIGQWTAVYLICCTNNFVCKITGKQLACYAGVVPFEHRSGISIKGTNRVHQMANKALKKSLHLCALSAIKYYPEFRTYYDRKKKEGKHSMSVINAVRNKLVLRIAAVINNQQPYVDHTAAA
jgi:transposase